MSNFAQVKEMSLEQYRKRVTLTIKKPDGGLRMISKGQHSGMDPRSLLERKFGQWWIALGGPDLVCNFQFHGTRKWCFDFAHMRTKTAIEIEGGSWTNGAHNRGVHFASDCEKYNAAAFLGWRVFRFTADQITVPALERLIKFIMDPGQFVK